MNHRGVYYTPTCDAIKDPVNKHRELVGAVTSPNIIGCLVEAVLSLCPNVVC